jgi:hypothetical protein
MYRYISRTLDDIITPSGSQSSSRAMQQCYDVQPSGVLDSLEQAYDSLSREVNIITLIISKASVLMAQLCMKS